MSRTGPGRNAVVTWGGWDGHAPEIMAEAAAAWLKEDGFEVEVTDDLGAYTRLADNPVGLVVQAVTMGALSPEQEAGLAAAVGAGTGLAGWHGGLCDSFRASTGYQFMTGGQWVAHPGGSRVTYTVDIAAEHPITRGVGSFEVTGEQYYLHTDPSNEVLATTTFMGTPEEPWTAGVVMPAVWCRKWGGGRVFYASFGHWPEELEIPEVETILRRGLLWAANAGSGR